MLWFNFIFGLNFILFCFYEWSCVMSLKQKRVKFKARIKVSHNTYALVQLQKFQMLISSIPFGRVIMIMNLKQKKNKIFIQGLNQTRTYSVHVRYLIRFIKETSTITGNF